MSVYKLRTIINRNFTPVQFRTDGNEHYQMFLEIFSDVDPKLEQVRSAEYILHPTFKNRQRTSMDRQSNFRIDILAWGTFVVRVIITTMDGERVEFEQDMNKHLEYEHL